MRRLIALITAFALAAQPVLAQSPVAKPKKPGLIRDAEIENTLRAYANPLLESAGIPPADVRILIVSDPRINAFVAGGLNIFIHTGMIRNTKKPGELMGVIAHETGHIAGAHLSQLQEKSDRAALGGLIGTILGAAAVAGGAGSAGAGVMMGSQSMAQRNLYSDIRINEQSADQAAMKYLDENEVSASGMLATFETMRRQEAGAVIKADPYLRTHPLTTERISTLRNHVEASHIPKDQAPPGFQEKQDRMIAKLAAFTEPYARVQALYPESDTSVAARYARAIAEYRRSRLEPALAGINELIKDYPRDAYFYDTKGQFLFENGKLAEAEEAYSRANSLAPNNALILTDFAKTIIARDRKQDLPRAIALLEQSKEIDDSYSSTWRQMAIAYGKQGKLGLSYMALAEEAMLGGDYKTVLQHVARAKDQAKNDRSLTLLLSDLQRDAEAQLEKKKENRLF